MILKELPRGIPPRQPGAHGGFLMLATPRAATEKTA
jgi:hypothetical protein